MKTEVRLSCFVNKLDTCKEIAWYCICRLH